VSVLVDRCGLITVAATNAFMDLSVVMIRKTHWNSSAEARRRNPL
jgi:hypothetical protein